MSSPIKFLTEAVKSVLSKSPSIDESVCFELEANKVSDEELLFIEMDLLIREEINKLEQALTDYLQACIGRQTDGLVENQFLTSITELYKKWAYLELPASIAMPAARTNSFSKNEKMVQLANFDDRRARVQQSIALRKRSWQKLSSKKILIEFEESILLGRPFSPNSPPRTLPYTIITVHSQF